MKFSRILAAAAFAVALPFSCVSHAQEADNLPNFVSVLPQIKAKTLPVDPQKGYLVKEVRPGVYVITDGMYQSAFMTTGKGVILFDAPPSFGGHIISAVAEVTSEPIVELVYSHVHVDHIGSADLILKQFPHLKIVAEEGTAEFLREMKDPHRPMPNRIFKDHLSLKLGSATAELKVGHWHSPEGDLFIYLPGKKFLMAIDTLAAGSVPFMGFDLTMNMHDYMKVFDQILAYDFDVLVAGHLTYLADRNDVQVTKDYVTDVYTTVKRIHDTANQMDIMSKAAQKYTWDNKFAVFRTVLDEVTEQCAKEIQGRWINKLDGVDVFVTSHCSTALVYARWDD
ncbi:MBL fold metallo-hydrolase [Solimicrobium silvestre]|uniref:Metallo-beta-lactamase superfamily n=1 Tax=Solimicrobium silvestre TaxID=2099400 RepID=A0A2S9H3M6_9BURK|nr:MBL fold metallo-hydrolase [Solimicrobium silvestre]PRC94585.1 Metallo-beta-lactamase superfamily [Solimicrobium silvestre]